MKYKNNANNSVAIIGAGYVGLALAIEFGKFINTLCFDIDLNKINQLKDSYDITGEHSKETILNSKKLLFSSDINDLKKFKKFIITVGTPVDQNNIPDLSAIIAASNLVGTLISKDSLVIYESTVFPGVTEEICIPILERNSKLLIVKDFGVGYSPERINPGDKTRSICNINKIISASDSNSLVEVQSLYKLIINAELYVAENIKTAEAAKVIENTQRDLNIALINEFSIIFDKMGIKTLDVINAAATKWNFINLLPGLVGGHCISVDPYYLTYQSERLGYVPALIHSGRKINEFMPIFISNKIEKKIKVNSKILILGITFKENCSDIRNTKVVTLYNELKRRQYDIKIFDPIANSLEVFKEYNIKLEADIDINNFDAIVVAVSHNKILEIINNGIVSLNKNMYIFDVQNRLSHLRNNSMCNYDSL